MAYLKVAKRLELLKGEKKYFLKLSEAVKLTKLTVVIISQYISIKPSMLYTFTLHSDVRLFLEKARKM